MIFRQQYAKNNILLICPEYQKRNQLFVFYQYPNIISLLLINIIVISHEENTSMAKNTNSHKMDNNTAVSGGLGFEAIKF